jgi:hypothetical protein
MKNLGNILIILVLAASSLMGAISASVDETRVQMGDTVTLTLKASGQDVEKPSITELCGAQITSTSQGTSMRSVNGRFTKEYLFAYTFTPAQDCRIDPVVLKIDGKEERTEPIDIRVVPMTITKDSPFILEMNATKRKVYVGEPLKLVVTFKQRRDTKPVDSKFAPPEVKNFWIKEEAQSRRFEEGENTVTRLTYIIAAQKPGSLAIDPAKIQIATRTASRDVWGQWLPKLKWRTYFSNPLEVEVVPLPEGVSLVGDFTIEATADKEEIDANEAVNVTITVSGSGNFEDIGSLKPEIGGVAVFDEEPKIDGYVEDGKYRGFWKQKLAYVAERSFTVPVMTLRYFDPETGRIETTTTEPIEIRVRGAKPQAKEPLVIARPEAKPKDGGRVAPFTPGSWEVPFGAGVLAGLLGGVLLMRLPRGGRSGASGGKLDINDQKAVLMQLLPHRSDPEVAEMVAILEGNLYGGSYHAVDKKQLKALLKRIAS